MIQPDRRPRLIAALAVVLAVCVSLPALAAQIKDVRTGSHPKFTRIVFELDGRAGYQVERGGTDAAPELKITIDASSSARVLRAIGDVRGVKVDAGTKARAHITLSDPSLRVHEMMLSDPPRIVIDLHKPETAIAATDKPAAKPKAEAKPEAKAVAKAPVQEKPKQEAPKPEAKAVAKAPVKETPKAEPAPKPAPAPAPVAPTPTPAPAPKADAATKAITPPAPAETAKAAPPAIEPSKPKIDSEQAAAPAIVPPPTAAPTLPVPPHDAKEWGPPAPATLPTPGGVAELPAPAPVPSPPAPPAAVVPIPTPPRAEPTPAAKPVTPPPAPEPGGSFTDHLSDPLWIGGGIAAAVLGLAAIGIVMRRRRALPNDLDVTAIAEEVERSAESPSATRIPSGGFAMGDDQPSMRSEAPTFASLFDKPAQDTEPVRSAFAAPPSAPDAPPAAPSPLAVEAEDSLFDDAGEMPGEPDAREGDAPMNQEMDLPVDRRTSPPAARMGGSAAASPAASPDITRLLQDMERRIATLEARLDESNEAREKLERQVAAQSEELRVQRAAIARTQRALRTMTRGDEDKATEPALRDGDTQAKTRVTP